MQDVILLPYLVDLPLGDWQYFDRVTSTNDIALAWAQDSAPDLALVVADDQSAGRGRFHRQWITTPGAALALSLVLHPTPSELLFLSRFAGLGALAIHTALKENWHLIPQIKWPNDIVVNRCKVAGILIENTWLGEQLQALVIGIGLNISPQAIPPPDQLMFPATSLETALGYPVDRWAVLHSILSQFVNWRNQLGSPGYIKAWNNALAFKGEWVTISGTGGHDQIGQVVGINDSGSLLLVSPDGKELLVEVGDVHLRTKDVIA